MKFRYDINALRAIAVIGVLLFHFKIPFFAGGFSGVDVFFVISGYLMSRIIIDALNDDKFSVVNFYSKRAKRIIPALLFLLVAISIVGFFIFLPIDYQEGSRNAASAVVFLSNIFFWKNSNYFDPASDTNILLHTWSLSVEWQFYLLLPLVLLIIHKYIKAEKKYVYFFSATTFLFFILAVVVTKISAKTSFYLLPSRTWELTMGGVAYLAEGVITDQRKKKFLSILGYAAILLCFVFLNNEMEWPGGYTLIPVIATVLILISNINDFKIIQVNIVQFTGKISYSLYLWHWPIYVIAQYLGFDTDSMQCIGAMLVLSVIFAYLSFKYIEAIHFNHAGWIVAAMVILFFGNFILQKYPVNALIFKPQTLAISNYKLDHEEDVRQQFGVGSCFITSSDAGLKAYNKTKCLTIDTSMKNVLLIGDSHAAQYSQSLRALFKARQINLMQATASGCVPVIRKNGYSRCSEIMSFIYNDYIVHHSAKISGVIICANWVDDKDAPPVLVDDLLKTIEYLKQYKINTIVIGQNETYKMPYASIAAREYQYNSQLHSKYLNVKSAQINQYLIKNLSEYYIDVYSTNPSPLSAGNIPYMSDLNHYTKYGADIVSKKLMSNNKLAEFFN